MVLTPDDLWPKEAEREFSERMEAQRFSPTSTGASIVPHRPVREPLSLSLVGRVMKYEAGRILQGVGRWWEAQRAPSGSCRVRYDREKVNPYRVEVKHGSKWVVDSAFQQEGDATTHIQKLVVKRDEEKAAENAEKERLRQRPRNHVVLPPM